MRTRAPLALVLALASGCPGVDFPWSTKEHEPRAEPRPAPQTPPAPAGSPASRAAASAPIGTTPAEELPAELVDDGSDDVPLLEPPPPPKTAQEAELLASTSHEAWVYAEPRFSARRLGYLRAGATVARRSEPFGGKRRARTSACPDGWFRVEPQGYVCVGGGQATLDVHDAVVDISRKRPTMDDLPYLYVLSRFPPPPLYPRVPNPEEQASVEPELASHLRKQRLVEKDASFVPLPEPEPMPGRLLYGRPSPKLGGGLRTESPLAAQRAKARSGFALLSTFSSDGRRFGLTTDLDVLPMDRTRVVRPSSFHGLELDEGVTLPVVFVKKKHATRRERAGAGVKGGAALAFREPIAIEPRDQRIGGETYYVARDGTLLRPDDVVRIDPPTKMPAWASGGRKWVDVSILRQALVAYQGTKPRYVTLVSTGADGLGDPKKTHSTIQGVFLIHTKHVSTTMDGDEDDRFDFRDVPFVQYFTAGYALHAAYWHDEFGTPRSHGCVNLAPKDAAWLFAFTDPKVPEGWHASLSLKRGTLVHTHP